MLYLASALDWKWMRYLGRISYSIHLYQQLTVGIANKFTAHYPLLVRLAAVALTILAANGSYFIVERYFLSLKALRQSPSHEARSLEIEDRGAREF